MRGPRGGRCQAGRAGLLPTWSAAAAGGAGLQEGRGVGWGTGRGPWRRPGPGSVAPEPCLRRSRGLRVSCSGLGAGDPSPLHGLATLYPLKQPPAPVTVQPPPARPQPPDPGALTSAPQIPPSPAKKFLLPPPPNQLPGGHGPFNRRLTDGAEWPMRGGVGAGRRLNPASTLAGRGRAGGEREAELKARGPIGTRHEAAGAGGGARQGDDVTWSEWRAAWNTSRDPGFRLWRSPVLTPHGTGGLGGRRGGSKGWVLRRRRLPETRVWVGRWGESRVGVHLFLHPLRPPRELHVASPTPADDCRAGRAPPAD